MGGVSDQDYEHVQQVWNRVIYEFEDVSLGDYYDVYLATDVSLLADDFVNFWNMFLKHCKKDQAYCYTAPRLALQAALKYTGVKLELLRNYSMLVMF